MKINDNYINIIFVFLFCIPVHGNNKFTDRQVAMMIPKYFARDHNAPKITRTRVYGKEGKKILDLNIEVNRNRYENQMGYAFSAMASVSQYVARPFDTFVLIMEQGSRQISDEKVEAKAKCTIDHFIFKRVKKDRWVNKYVNIREI